MGLIVREETIEPFLSVEQTIIFPISSLSVMYFIYGIYVLLFGTCVYMMRRRHGQHTHEMVYHNFYLVLAIILFILSTIFVVDYTIDNVRDPIIRFTAVSTGDYDPLLSYLMQDTQKTINLSVEEFIPIFLNVVAEWMLIQRCYVIWSSRKRVGVPLIVASVVVNALGLAGAIITTVGLSNTYDESNYNIYFVGDLVNFVYNVVSAVNNFTITLLTAGRIWWIHRQVQTQTPAVFTSDRLVQSVSRIIVESGVIYPITQIISVIAINTSPGLNTTFDFLPLATLSAAIAPTLILVRGRLGKNVESLQDTVSDIQFTSRVPVQDGTTTISSPTRAHSVGIFSMKPPNLERDEEALEKAQVNGV